ncbi:MFS transporter [Sphingomonas sp. RHCKR7]|uniref:MFS transporter n=1 Tax=Sphingomonas folli TaxID=2862497 RepID=UPI001CA4D1C0|nr:MFS transporter [Sphingomonas folli]MBW6526485.1 MFS transporter [Sphingomonas folli]
MSASLAEDGSAEAVAGAAVHGRGKWVLVVSLGAVFFVLYTLYAAVLGVLLPNQIQDIDPSRKASMLGMVFAVTSIFSTTVTPLSGSLSDRTRTRGGLRRTPWILTGGVVGGVTTILIPHGGDIVGVTILWVIATICLNSMQPAITTVVADRFRASERGMVSGVVGACMTAGISAGTIFGGLMAARLSLAYGIIGAAILLVCVAFTLINPEPPIAREVPAAPRLTPAAFLRGFWISPREHPDFAWAFLGRFAIYMGYQAILTYLLYILQDHIGLSQAQANATIARMSSVTLVMLVISGLLSGWLSDRIGRLKPLVFVAGLLMAAAVMAPLISPDLPGMFGYAVLIGLGYGAFMSIDLALMTHVLPKRGVGEDTTGRDLGILTTAVNVPQIISPVMAAALLGATHNNYPLLFVAAAGFVVAGSLFVLPIRSVR